ncbi:MAG: ATP-binding cassette domain-containing protein [Planctomycetia bacterium]|nr:ATP-binding cassette domain-containing protein [Planctomycetia bacterium]
MLVHIDQLTKRYGSFFALDTCSLGVREGDVFGLLGPNGAGKTTLLRLLMGFTQPRGLIACINRLKCALARPTFRAKPGCFVE